MKCPRCDREMRLDPVQQVYICKCGLVPSVEFMEFYKTGDPEMGLVDKE